MHPCLRARSRALLAAALAAAALLASRRAAATTIVPLAVEDMTQIASDVVLGRVTRVVSEYSGDRSQIFTYVTVSADQRLKGDGAATQTFVLWGGRVGDDEMAVVDSPRFAVGEQVIVFLGQMRSRVPLTQPTDRWLLGLGNGKWSVTTDPATKQLVARSTVSGTARALPLAQLTTRVAAAIRDADARVIRGGN